MINYLPAVFWALIILFLSTGVQVQLPKSIFSMDKVGHLIAYFILGWLALWALRRENMLRRQIVWITFTVVSLYGIFLEFIQWKFYPSRFFEVWDMIANITGALISVFVFQKWKLKEGKNKLEN